MVKLWLRCDLRSPEFGTSAHKVASIHLEQAEWADRHGFETVQLPEHHGCPDGYNPSPFELGAAIAARTSKVRLHPSAVLLPLLDPIRLAEDAAVLDLVSGGRLDMTIGLGYLPSEFAMFGVALADRANLVERKIAALRKALAGESFEYEGRQVCVRPRPVQQPTPPIYIGGGVPASAKRAARLGDGFYPSSTDPMLRTAYIDACRQLGKVPGPILEKRNAPQFVFVSEDPEEAWRRILPHAMYETNFYASWQADTGVSMPFKAASGMEELKATGLYEVVTPDECIKLARRLYADNAILTFNPMLAGLDERFSWSSLELFTSKVLPHISPSRADPHVAGVEPEG